MARLMIRDNPLDFDHGRECRYTGPLLDWILREYPNGWPGPHLLLLNGEKLPVPEYDAVLGEDDEVLILIAPTGELVAADIIITAIVTALASAAVSYALNWLFGEPVTPGGADVPSASPVYSLSAPTNQARLGQPVPVIYGSVLAVPDIASQPYTWFEDNEQYLGVLLCVGNGQHNVHYVQLADTLVAQMPSGIVEYWVFQPWQHNQTPGTITATSGLVENMDTSPEVADQELLLVEAQRTNAADLDIPTRTLTLPVPIETTIVAGDTVTLTEFAPNSGTYTIESIAADYRSCVLLEDLSSDNLLFTAVTNVRLIRTEETWISIEWSDATPTGDWVGAEVSVTTTGDYAATFSGRVIALTANGLQINDQGETAAIGADWLYCDSAAITITPTGAGIVTFERQDVSAGPFSVNRPGTLTTAIFCDIVFPQGLYSIDDDGNFGAAAVDILFDYEQIDDDGVPTGTDYQQTVYVGRATTTPQRITVSQAVAAGRYRVSAGRLTGISDDVRDQSQCIWTGLKARLDGDQYPVWGETTMMAVKIRATNGIASNAQDRIGVQCTRILDAGATTNPIDALEDIFTNTVYGGRRPANSLDQARLAELHAKWAGGNGFNAVFDSRQTVWEAAKQAVQVERAYPVVSDGLVTLVEDASDSLIRIAFDESNIARDSIQSSYQFDGVDDIDGYQVAYRDPATWLNEYELYPADSVNPESINFFGCTEQAAAAEYAQFLWQRRTYRRRQIAFDSEMDGLIPLIGDRISVQHRILGATPLRCIVARIEPGDGSRTKITTMRDDDRVYEGVTS